MISRNDIIAWAATRKEPLTIIVDGIPHSTDNYRNWPQNLWAATYLHQKLHKVVTAWGGRSIGAFKEWAQANPRELITCNGQTLTARGLARSPHPLIDQWLDDAKTSGEKLYLSVLRWEYATQNN